MLGLIIFICIVLVIIYLWKTSDNRYDKWCKRCEKNRKLQKQKIKTKKELDKLKKDFTF